MQLVSRDKRLYVLLIILLSVLAFLWHQNYQRHERYLAQQKARAERHDVATAKTLDQFESRFDWPSTNWFLYPDQQPDLAWQLTTRQTLDAAQAGAHFGYIVLPLQENYPEDDRTALLMASRYLAEQIQRRTHQAVMSPELAYRLLGPTAKQFRDAKAEALAKRFHAKLVVFLGKDKSFGHGHWLHLATILADDSGHIKHYALKNVKLNKGKRPLEPEIERVAPALAAKLVPGAPTPKQKPVVQSVSYQTLPDKLDGLVTDAKTPLDHAVALQLLALLTPHALAYQRHRLFERSLMALEEISPKSAGYDVLKARALFYLYRRPWAMPLLARTSSAAGKALKAYLNGNYPAAAKWTREIKNPVLKAAADLELTDLSYHYYEKPPQPPVSLNLPNLTWASLLDAGFHDDDDWYAPDNQPFFQGLDGLLPSFDKAFSQTQQARVLSGESDGDTTGWDLMQAVFDKAGHQTGEGHFSSRLEAGDLWRLYQDLAVGNSLRHLYRDVQVYGDYDDAVSLAQNLAPSLLGQPHFMNLYAQALYNEAKSVSGNRKNQLLTKAHKLAYDAIVDAGHLSQDSADAYGILSTIASEIPKAKLQFPPHGAYAPWPGLDFPSYALQYVRISSPGGLPYTNSNFGTLEEAAQYKTLQGKALQKVLAARFDGNPLKAAFEASRLENKGDIPGAIKSLEKAIAEGDSAWNTYNELGHLYLGQGQYKKARDTYLRYPPFTDSNSQTPVSDSNDAYDAGSKFFWSGRYVMAEALYQICVSLQTGAASDYSAVERIALLHQDYAKALITAFHDARRYNDRYRFRDYLVLMHLLGYHQQADAGFKALSGRFDTPDLWESKLIGDRMRQVKLSQQIKSSEQFINDHHAPDIPEEARWFIANQLTMDRAPDIAAIKQLKPLDKSPAIHEEMPGKLAQAFNTGHKNQAPVSLNSAPRSPLSQQPHHCAGIATQPAYYDSLLGFTTAFADFSSGHEKAAWHQFLALDCQHAILNNKSLQQALPFMAMTAVEAGNKDHLDRLMAILHKSLDGNNYNLALAEAVQAADQGHAGKALLALKRAFHYHPLTGWRPMGTWYQLALTSEWLYKRTHDRRFIDTALTWANRFEKIQPQFGWAYAFQARYAKDRDTRVQAAAFAHYLDPQSLWLSQVPSSIRKQGKRWWQSHNPFKAAAKTLQDEQARASANQGA